MLSGVNFKSFKFILETGFRSVHVNVELIKNTYFSGIPVKLIVLQDLKPGHNKLRWLVTLKLHYMFIEKRHKSMKTLVDRTQSLH